MQSTIPASIPFDGSRDVTAEVNEWLASLPDSDSGRTWGLFRPGIYRCDGTVLISGKRGITIDGSGATIVTDDPTGDGSLFAAPSRAARTRAHVRITGCERVSVHRLNVRGPNSNGGTDSIAYDESLEAQHAYDIQASSEIVVGQFEASLVYGDIVYIGVGHCSNVTARHFTGHHNGRQGVGITNADHVLIHDANLHDIRHSLVDLEPATASWWVDGVEIRDNTFGPKRLTWLAALGKGRVNNVTVENNTINAPANIQVAASDGTRRSGWVITGNVATQGYGSPLGHAMNFSYVDGLTVTGNTVPLGDSRPMWLASCVDCTDVDVSGNDIGGGLGQLQPAA